MTERTLFLNGTIAEESWFDDDVTPKMFRDELFSGDGDIVIWMNSPGGDCVAASQIYSMLMDYKGNVTVKIEGVDFVKGGQCYEIGLKVSEATGFYTPFWPQNAEYKVLENGTRDYDIDGAIVFDLDKEISSD